MSEDKIVVPSEVVEDLKKLIRREEDFIVSEHPFDPEYKGSTLGFKSEEKALEHLKREWVEEQQRRSEWLFCPHCDRRLDVARNVANEQKEAVARLEALLDFIGMTMKHDLKYRFTKRQFVGEGGELRVWKGWLETYIEQLQALAHGSKRTYYKFPQKRVAIRDLDEKETKKT